MARYRKKSTKPLVIEAEQYTEDLARAMVEGEIEPPFGLKPQEVTSEEGCPYMTGRLYMTNIGGFIQLVEPGDWIITGPAIRWLVTKKIFEEEYEAL